MKPNIYWKDNALIALFTLLLVLLVGVIAHSLWQSFGIYTLIVPACVAFVSFMFGLYGPEL